MQELLPKRSEIEDLRSKQKLGEMRAMVRAVRCEFEAGITGIHEELADIRKRQDVYDERIAAVQRSILPLQNIVTAMYQARNSNLENDEKAHTALCQEDAVGANKEQEEEEEEGLDIPDGDSQQGFSIPDEDSQQGFSIPDEDSQQGLSIPDEESGDFDFDWPNEDSQNGAQPCKVSHAAIPNHLIFVFQHSASISASQWWFGCHQALSGALESQCRHELIIVCKHHTCLYWWEYNWRLFKDSRHVTK